MTPIIDHLGDVKHCMEFFVIIHKRSCLLTLSGGSKGRVVTNPVSVCNALGHSTYSAIMAQWRHCFTAPPSPLALTPWAVRQQSSRVAARACLLRSRLQRRRKQLADTLTCIIAACASYRKPQHNDTSHNSTNPVQETNKPGHLPGFQPESTT